MLKQINNLNDYFCVLEHIKTLKRIKIKNIIFLVLNSLLALSLIIFFIFGGLVAYNASQYHCYEVTVINFVLMIINLISLALSGSLIFDNVMQIKSTTNQIKYYLKLLKG